MACGSLLSEEDLCRFRTKKCRRLTSGSCEFGITRCQYSHNQYWSRRCPIYLSDRSFIRYIHVLCPCVTIKPTGDYEGPLPCGKYRCKQLLNCLLNSAAIAALDALPQERRQSQAPYCSTNVRKGGGGGACGKDRDNESCWCPYPGEEVIENTCGRGGECPFAHSIEEILYHPLFYKMVICGNYRKGVCDTYYCPYVHGLAERRRPSEYKLPFTTGIDIPPLPFVTVVTRIEKKKESVAPPLEASLASTASASDGACCSPQTERTDCSITAAPGKYAVFFRDRLTCTRQEGPTGRWRKALGRSSSRRSGGTAKRDFHRKGSLPSHLSSASLQATVWNAPVRGETSLLENLEPVAEEVANQSEDFLDACKKKYVDAFTKGYADTSVRSFADAFAKGHVDACVKRYADAHGDPSANTCTKDPDDAFPNDYAKAHESEGQTVDPSPTTAATAAADLFSTSFLPAGSPMGLVGHEVLLNTNLLEGDLTAEALAPFLSVNALQTNAAADVVSTLPHVQLVAAALELYDKSAAKVRSDEPIGVRTNTLKNFFGASSGTGPGFGRSGERCVTAQQDASGPSGTTEIGESNIAPDVVSASCCRGEYDKERDCKGANSDGCQAGENLRSVGEVEDVSPTACSPGSSCWLPFLSPCIVSPESSVAEPLTARVRAAGADVLEKLFAGARQCTNEAAVGKFAGDTSVPIETGAMSSPPATARRVPLPPGIPVSALMFSAPAQHSGTADAAGMHHAVHADCGTLSETTHGKSRGAGASFSQTTAGNVRVTDTGAFTRRDDMGAGVPRRGNTTLGTGIATDEDFGNRQRQNPQKCISETCTSDKERRRTFCEPEVAQEEQEVTCNKDENARRIEVIGRKQESGHSTNCGSDTKPLQQEEAAQPRVTSMVSCDMLKGTAMRRENRASQSKREEETQKTEEELLSDEGEKHNHSRPLTHWTLAGASGSAARLSKPKQEQDVHVMEREEGILAGDDCGCPLAESVLQSLEKSVRILTTTGWKGSVKQLKRMHKAAGELWELIHCGHVSSQAEVTGTSSPDPFSELFSFLDSMGGDCVSQRCTTALSTLLPGKTQPTEK